METIIKAAAICIPAAFIAQALRKDSPVMSLCILVAAGFLTLFMASGTLRDIVDAVSELADTAGLSSASVSAVTKTLGISIVARLTADTLKDAGMGSAASAVELAGAAAGIFVTLPLLKTLVEMVGGLV